MSTQSLEFTVKRLVGTWEQPSQGADGMGVILTLAPEGSATLASGIVEDLNYNFDGKQLIVVDAEDPEDVKQISTVVLRGDSMKETNSESGQSAEFVRVTPALLAGPAFKNEPNSLVGAWKRDVQQLPAEGDVSEAEKAKRREIAQNGRYYYKSDGRLLVRIPLSVEPGKWDVASDGMLKLEFGGKAQEGKISFENGDLVLTNAGGRQVYRKAEQ